MSRMMRPAVERAATGRTLDAMELWQLTAVDLAARLRRREVSAVEALEAILGRVERVAPAANPFSVRLDDRARRAAEHADRLLARGDGGPLCGVPVTAKDSQWLAGVESAYGSLTMVGFVPHETTVALERLERAGAVIFAKTAVPEFCYTGICESPVHGRTSNPWNLGRVPGGSSGGAGVAVATGLGPLSLGGDGGGSIRIPAAFCGVVGFKPTFGVVPREPCSDAWRTLVAVGPLARTVADARLMVGVVAGLDQRDRHSIDVVGLDEPPPEPGALRVVVSEDLGFAHLDDDVRRAFRAAVAGLAAAGVEVVDDHPGQHSSVRTWATIAAAEARYAESREYEHRLHEMTERAAHFMHFGGRVTAEDYVHAQFERERLHRAYLDMFERTGASVLLTPTLGCEAFPHGTNHPLTIGGVEVSALWMDWAPFLYDANLCGYPAASIPIGFGDDGLPIGLHVMGLRARDGAVLAAAELVESIVGRREWPPEATMPLVGDHPGAVAAYDAGAGGGIVEETIAPVL
jgi:Asp-tRNA(Asn)/Glu-tRNA(Gln) amidotransferase A subunit family amidase